MPIMKLQDEKIISVNYILLPSSLEFTAITHFVVLLLDSSTLPISSNSRNK